MFRALGILAVLALVAGSASAHAATPQKLALLVGIDDYNGDGAPKVTDRPWSRLSGCVNDTAKLATELERRGFKVATLTNAQATRTGILDAIGGLAKKAKSGDIVLFHYSGHGQQIPDDEANADEEDGFDESLVPFDNKGIKDGSANLRDDDLGKALSAISKVTPNLVVTLDSCHSGTATRGQITYRGTTEPAGPPLAKGKRPTSGKPAGWMAGKDDYVLLSAARPDELANEAKDPETGEPMGAFTSCLIAALREAGDGITYDELLARVSERMSTRSQHPRIEGAGKKKLFSGKWGTQAKGFRVRPVPESREITIEAGTLQGLQAGDEVLLHGADPVKPVARAKLSSADLALSRATLVPEDAAKDLGALKDGARAVPVSIRYAGSKLTVAVPSGFPGRSQLAAPFLELREPSPGNPVDLQIVESAGQIELLRGDGSAVPIPLGAGEAPLSKIEPGKVALLKFALESYHRQSLLRALANRDAGSRAAVTLHVRPVETRGEEIVRALPELARGADVPFGTRLEFLIENRGDKPLHPVILDLSVDGSVTVLYPREGLEAEVVRPRSTLALGALGVFEQGPPAGPGTFKLIATEQEVDFRGLELAVQAGKRGESGGPKPEGADSALGELFTSILETSTRGSKPLVIKSKSELWGTDVVEVQLVPSKTVQ